MAKKGQVPWNKGLSKDTDDRVKKYANTKSILQKGTRSKKAKYSFNSDEWVNICSVCGKIQKYLNRDSYSRAMRMIEKNGEYKCCKCSISRNVSEKTLKIKKRKLFLDSLTLQEKKAEISKNMSEIQKRRWENISEYEREVRNEKIRNAKLSMDAEKKKKIYHIISLKNKEKMLDSSGNFVFKPGYNKDTIPYIENILNIEYNTVFRHAESDDGEFKIYDKELKKFYYADAYSSELNIWIEFDEPNKFKNGKLDSSQYLRESRIKDLIPNVLFSRIYFDRTKHKIIKEN